MAIFIDDAWILSVGTDESGVTEKLEEEKEEIKSTYTGPYQATNK